MFRPIYRMSSAGKCPRALSAIRLGVKAEEAPPWLEKAANEGNWHEQRIKDELRADDIAVYGEQKEVIIDHPSFQLLGHIDGMVNDHGKEMLLEIKSMSQFEFDRWMKGRFEEFPGYADQLTCYMKATRIESALYIVKNRSSGYEDRSIITEQPSSLDTIIEKFTALESWISLQKKLYPANFDPLSLECKRCFYKLHCPPEQLEPEPATEVQLITATKLVRVGRRLIDEGEATFNEGRDILKKHGEARELTKWLYSELVMQVISVHKESYSKKKLLEQFAPEQLEFALDISDYTQFKITDLLKEN